MSFSLYLAMGLATVVFQFIGLVVYNALGIQHPLHIYFAHGDLPRVSLFCLVSFIFWPLFLIITPVIGWAYGGVLLWLLWGKF